MKRFFMMVACLILTCAIMLAGCASDGTKTIQPAQNVPQSTRAPMQTAAQTAVAANSTFNIDEMFTDRDRDSSYDVSTAVAITLVDSASTASSQDVIVQDNRVTITADGTYILTGTLSDGQIVVDCPSDNDKVQLIFNGVNITCNGNAAVWIKQADKVFITLAEETENSLITTGMFPENDNVDATILSKEDLILNGQGSLVLCCENGHGIVSKDDLVMTGGTYTITAASHGLAGKDSVRIADGTFNIISGKDGIHSENVDDAALGYAYIAGGTFNIEAETDGIDAAYALWIDDGDFTIKTGGGSVNASMMPGGGINNDWGKWGKASQMSGYRLWLLMMG